MDGFRDPIPHNDDSRHYQDATMHEAPDATMGGEEVHTQGSKHQPGQADFSTHVGQASVTLAALHLNSPSTAFSSPTGPKNASSMVPLHQFTGITNPAEMHAAILHNRIKRRYYSLTILPEPYTPWSPLPHHRQMETRPCFSPASRIHLLKCGHTIAVPRDAERCAANCQGLLKTMNAIDMDRAARLHGSILQYLSEFPELATTYNGMPIIRNTVDQNGGDFDCVQCNTTGLRPSAPAKVLMDYFCILVVRDQRDATLFQQLELGVKHVAQRLTQKPDNRNHFAGDVPPGSRHGGPGGAGRAYGIDGAASTRGAFGVGRGGQVRGRFSRIGSGRRFGSIQDSSIQRHHRHTQGRVAGARVEVQGSSGIDRMRKEEKKDVIEKLRDEQILEEWEKMQL
ncbi:hypothetical protein BCR34DRAFT_582682 [Clohesyomyces aquaticus]|uniref:Uncharacterized protein n=1 Tax=Clohesyomyces aquaticus TaxID=1231657 RepID=A0A1Y2A892_9PLEO|nr:hypothetical protein BCR34DRAFT_582682 [Clohesyomyces aquaticus]